MAVSTGQPQTKRCCCLGEACLPYGTHQTLETISGALRVTRRNVTLGQVGPTDSPSWSGVWTKITVKLVRQLGRFRHFRVSGMLSEGAPVG